MSDYIIHKAVELSKVKKARRQVLEAPGYLQANYLAQPKHDGCNAVIKIRHSGHIETLSRTGEPNRAMGRVERALAGIIPPGHVVLGEAWWPGADQFSEISGHFRRHQESDRLGLVAFDMLTIEEFEKGHSSVPYHVRFAPLQLRLLGQDRNVVRPVSSMKLVETDPQENCNWYVAKGGYDGIIYRDPNGTWTAGSGTTGEIIKIKRKLSFALRVTGVVEGLGKNRGRAGSITVLFNGKALSVNAGTDAQRHSWFDNPSSIVGKIIEVEAMDYSSEGLLREPRFKGIRDDVTTPDA